MHITTKGSDPKMLSNKGVFTVNDPLYYCGHPQVSFKYGISILIDFLWLYKSLTNKLLLEDINYSSTDNSNGGKNEAMVIHSITLKSRVYTVIKHSSPHTKQWIGFELKSINIDTNTIVVFELTSFDNKIIFLRRKNSSSGTLVLAKERLAIYSSYKHGIQNFIILNPTY